MGESEQNPVGALLAAPPFPCLTPYRSPIIGGRWASSRQKIHTMGLDYSYDLRFRRTQLKEILLAMVERSEPNSKPPVEVILPGGEESIFLPFWVLPQQIRPASFDHRFPPFFGTSLWFDPDEPFERYAAAQAAEGHPLPHDAQGRVSFGSIYLSVYMKPTADNPDLEFLDFDFSPATSQMSILFAASESVRRFFVQLLEEHNGISGKFVDSDYGWGPITIWPETAPDYNPENLLDLHNRLAPDKPYYRFPLGF